ncbi:hypothetical protein VOLCADRAFT_33666, partial [Volvox carteri f. nagariensis]
KFCEPCVMGKMTRSSHPPSTHKSECPCPLGLVRMDACGPMPVTSLGGARYIATFYDDFSK